MRIGIFGAGAIGGHLAVKLVRAGHDVSVVARGPLLENIQAQGLTLKAGDQSSTVDVLANSDASELGPQDVVIVAVKATGLAAMADKLKPLVTPKTGVIFIQNGMPWWYPIGLHEKQSLPDLAIFRLAKAFLSYLSPSQIIGGSIYSANAVISPGIVRNNSPQRNQLSIDSVQPESVIDVAALRAIFEGADISSPPTDGDIRALIWAKLVFNMSGSAIALATNNKSSISRKDPELAIIFRRIMMEGLQISKAHGFPLDDRIDIDRVLSEIPDHKPSLLQDFILGRHMEIGEIIRAPQAFARAAGLETPSLDVLCAIVTRLAIDSGLYSD